MCHIFWSFMLNISFYSYLHLMYSKMWPSVLQPVTFCVTNCCHPYYRVIFWAVHLSSAILKLSVLHTMNFCVIHLPTGRLKPSVLQTVSFCVMDYDLLCYKLRSSVLHSGIFWPPYISFLLYWNFQSYRLWTVRWRPSILQAVTFCFIDCDNLCYTLLPSVLQTVNFCA